LRSSNRRSRNFDFAIGPPSAAFLRYTKSFSIRNEFKDTRHVRLLGGRRNVKPWRIVFAAWISHRAWELSAGGA